VPPATWIALLVLVVGILVVELGGRDPTRGLAVEVPAPDALRPAVERLRAIPQEHVPGAAAGAVAAGVVFGRADDVAPADQQAFLDSGLWHLLAASGQNIALVAGSCVLLARAVGAGRTTGGVAALVAIPLYVLVVGGGASIVRAGITGVLVLVAWLAGRLADARHVLVVAAAAICWSWPGAHRGLGMQLSFACVAALVAWASPMTSALAGRGLPRWLAGALAATLLCSIATAPILHLRTGAAPLTGIAANVVAVPIAGALLVVGLAGSLVVLAIPEPLLPDRLGAALLLPAGTLAELLLQVARRAAAFPLASSSAAAVNIGVPALVLAATRSRAARPIALVVVVVVGSVLLLAGGAGSAVLGGERRLPPADPGILRIGVLDVGQGDATLLTIDGRSLLVDTGPPDGRVVQRARALGVDRIDGVVLTHDSLDHRGGYDDTLGGLQPAWVVRPAAAPGPWRHVEETAPRLVDTCRGGVIELGAARVEVLHPPCSGRVPQRTDDPHNDAAMVLLVTHGNVRALLPADAEAPVLLDLSIPDLDLLRVSHHGSADPRLTELLARTRPEAAAISVGEGNEYGHPRRDVLDALRLAGVRTHRTDQHGTIVYESDGEALSIVE
jgi:competence protein ComEC